MIAYLDSSALVPLLVAEPASQRCQRVWLDADVVATSLLSYIEVHAALAQAQRLNRLTRAARREAAAQYEQLWQELTVIAPSEQLVREAATLAHTHALRGYDAVQCATALSIADDDFVAVTGDRRLLAAWQQLALITVNTSAHDQQ